MPHFICIQGHYINIDHIIRFYYSGKEIIIVISEQELSEYGDMPISKKIIFKFKDTKECEEKIDIIIKALMTFKGCSVTVV